MTLRQLRQIAQGFDFDFATSIVAPTSECGRVTLTLPQELWHHLRVVSDPSCVTTTTGGGNR